MANRSLNRATLIGNVGNEPELRSTPQGIPVTSIRLATHSIVRDKNSSVVDLTEWHNVVFWRDLANKATSLLKKGSKIYVEGPLRTRRYEKEGASRYITELIADTMIVLENKIKQTEDEFELDDFRE